ncbi:uncharacterized protein LOC21385805 isoform X1 [Morus notabilis]|uniref:uncharacterized protein LOC21385805 isoform X1 n=1 Tax=Morus notabilis TaxID=981085 RepID=UPI000CED581C|nr:uncharacterized protein LOC21385805 isoform X1 [Morus notabilis]XP_024029745.1 uncharacterized protein LOC21385805 isoform X1 [Morus notabilis]XP_024029746.1 uncharacterized protein LOC21385805 isoform X1 [Morus notabilis]
MAPSKASKKQQKRGVDFKKIKRKIGRKLPPPKNATNTEIKSKAIILPEQSVASEKAGLAVNKKGLTLKELLQQTSHHNAKVRKDALVGIRGLLLKHPAELTLHKYAVIEKLRERIGDDDKVVRETLYQLFKSVIFPDCKEDNLGVFISLLTAYIFSAMTHLAIEVRLMAFKFFDLVVQYYPNSFFLYAEKILQNYEDILRKNKFYLQEKGKLKTALFGLVRCLSLLPCDRREADVCEKKDAGQRVLHAFEPDLPTESDGYAVIIPKVKELVPVLVNCFEEFIPGVQAVPSLDAQSFDCMLCLLQSIDRSIRFFLHFTGVGNLESEPSPGGLDADVWTKTISTLSKVLLKKLLVLFPLNSICQVSEKGDERYFTLNIAIAEIFLHLSEWTLLPTVSLETFLEFIESALFGKICGGNPGKAVKEKHLLTLLPFIPKLVSLAAGEWKPRLLQAFTKAFMDCNPESALKLACLSTIEEMLIPREDMMFSGTRVPEILDHQIAWIRELPVLLMQLGDKHQSSSQAVLRLLLKVGQCALLNPSLAWEYDNMQYSLKDFVSTCLDDGNICYGPFVKLPSDCQELSLCCIYYFSFLDSPLLKSISSCCLCSDLEPPKLLRILEVLNSVYKAGRIQIADHISFFTTLLSRFRVFPDNIFPVTENDAKISNRGTFKSVISIVCSYISQMGDNSLVFQILENVVLEQITLRPPLDNVCALLRLLATLDSKPTRLNEESITSLGNLLSGYLIDIALCIPKDGDENSICSRTWHYYLIPCFVLFDKSHRLLQLVLQALGSLITRFSSLSPHDQNQNAKDCSSTIDAAVSVLLSMHKDVKILRIISSFKEDVHDIFRKIVCLQSSEEIRLNLEEKHKVQCSVDKLKVVTSSLDKMLLTT